MRLCKLVPGAAIVSLAVSLSTSAAFAGPVARPAFDGLMPARPIILAATDEETTYDIDLVVGLSGKCTVFRAAGRNLPCRAVQYFHGEIGRAFFPIAVDDPADKGRIVSFSGDKSRRDGND